MVSIWSHTAYTITISYKYMLRNYEYMTVPLVEADISLGIG
jgi:hypothetical protein